MRNLFQYITSLHSNKAGIKQNVIPLVVFIFSGFACTLIFIYYSYGTYLNEIESVVVEEELESRKMRINSELMEMARARTRLTSQIIDTEDPFEQDELNLQLETYAGQFAQLRTQLLALDLKPEEREILNEHARIIPVILPAQREAVELAMSDSPVDDKKAQKILYDTVLPGQGELINTLARLIELEQNRISELSLSSIFSVQSIRKNSTLLTVIALITLVVLFVLIIRRIKLIQDKLFNHQKNLESLVNERTTELTQSNLALEDSLNDMKKAQERLIETEKMVSLGQLVSGIAHEVNTPIGISVTANSHLMEQIDELDDSYLNKSLTESKMKHFIKDSKDVTKMLSLNLERAAELIKSFKQVAVDQSNEEMRDFDLEQYLGEVIRSLEPQIRKTRHRIELSCPDHILIHSTPGVFSQIFTNLILNSILHGFDLEPDKKRSFEGLMKVYITLEQDTIVITYTDNGKGMNEEQIKNVFEPFFTTKRGKGGTGLGMFIMYNLITQKLSGNVRCSSIPDNGVTFVITIPHVKPAIE